MNVVGCGQSAVYDALAYRTNSKKAGEIRELALGRFGGVKTNILQLVR